MFRPITTDIELDHERHIVRKSGQEIHLTGLEYGLLEYLVNHPNRICTRAEIIEHVWGTRFQYDTGTIDVHLNALRKKMGWNKSRPIESIRGLGLLFRIERDTTHYTIDLQRFIHDWLRAHETELLCAGLTAQVHLSPFVNEMSIEPSALQGMLDSILTALLPSAQPGVMRVSSKLTMQYFLLTIDISGTINELRIPLKS